MTFERRAICLRIAWVIFVVIGAPLAVAAGYLVFVRYALVILFLCGALSSVIGYIRYLPPGPKAPALLMLSIEKKAVDFFLALGFLFSVLLAPSSNSTSWVLYPVYSSFGAAGAMSSFLGMYLLFGAGRGWISRSVYKNPFHLTRAGEDSEENSQGRGGHRLEE